MRKLDLQTAKGAGKSMIKEINQKLILNLVREHQPISRAEISKRTRLQRSTVTIISNRLLSKGWIYEGESGRYGGGRRPKHLYLNPKKLLALGVEVGREETLLALADLNGELIDRAYFKTTLEDPTFFTRLAKKIRSFSDHSRPRRGVEVAGVGIGLPGYIEKNSGRIIAAENFCWMNVPAGDYLRKHLDFPIYFENVAKLAAFAELWFGKSKNGAPRNLVHITTRDGLGTGLILNGEIFNGARDGAAEFGHFSLVPDGERCVCGNYGCWEVYASDMATVKRYLQSRNGSTSEPPSPEKVGIREVIEAARRGDHAARTALQSTAKYLGIGISNLLFGLNPELVTVGDELAGAWDLIEEEIVATVRGRVPSYYLEGVEIGPTSLKEAPSLLGAIALVLADIFSISKQP
ncbi:MAG TPA: ROK family transcriptional regulator [Terriglobia bacterium]|nr:ROK family transcriptional regulator [Terriglobia bacterium]